MGVGTDGTQAVRSLAEIDEALAAARLATAHAGSALLAEAIGPRRLRAGRGAPYAAWGDPALLDAYTGALAREQALIEAYTRALAEATDAAARTQWLDGGAR